MRISQGRLVVRPGTESDSVPGYFLKGVCLMRWIAVLIALWVSPLGLLNEPNPDDVDGPSVAAERGGCPGGVCRPKRPRPKR